MPFHIWVRGASCVAGVRKAFGICLERLSRSKQVAYDIILRERAAETVVIGDDLTGGEHEVIADRRVGIRIILGRQTIFFGQTVEVRHGRIANHA